MKKRKRTMMMFAMIVLVIVVIGSITAAAISFGSYAKSSADSANIYNETNNNEDDSDESKTITDTSTSELAEITDREGNTDFSEIQNYNNSVPFSDDETIPYAIREFAFRHGLTTEHWPQSLIDMLIKYPQTEEFVLNYPFLKNMTYDIDITDSGYEYEVPLFLQWDKRWGYTTYGDDMIANAGCGPTCLSMVCTYLLQDPSLDPKTVAEFSMDYGYCCPGFGSYWSLIYEGGEILGLNVEPIYNDEESIVSELEAGNPIICLVGPGDFTYGGHFIVLTDYIDGKIKINDPNSIENSEKLWDYSDIEYQLDELYACSV